MMKWLMNPYVIDGKKYSRKAQLYLSFLLTFLMAIGAFYALPCNFVMTLNFFFTDYNLFGTKHCSIKLGFIKPE